MISRKKFLVPILVSIAFIILLSFLQPTKSANASYPSLVARLSFLKGNNSFLPAGQTRWIRAKQNYPLTAGDRVWAGNNAFLELELNNAVTRLGSRTSVKLLNLSPKMTQLQLSSGSIVLKVRQLAPNQLIEISMPKAAFTIAYPGYYRIFVNEKNKLTSVAVVNGQGKLFVPHVGTYPILKGKFCSLTQKAGAPHCTSLPKTDALERISHTRDSVRRTPPKYVSPRMIGYEDLENHGTWRATRQYGHVWIPTHVATDWAPYRDGHWVWVRQWGWTWVDEQPWGFAPFHYGRWVYFDNRWVWVPGDREVEPVYAPALVAFVGGRDFNLRLSSGTAGIAWIPLAPDEIYIPQEPVSREYFVSVNLSNTRIPRTQIINNYQNTNVTVNYQNINVPNGVTAVSTTAFREATPVKEALQTVPKETLINAPKGSVAAVTPSSASVLGGTSESMPAPPKEVIDEPQTVTVEPSLEPSKSEEMGAQTETKTKPESVKPNETVDEKIDEPMKDIEPIKPQEQEPTELDEPTKPEEAIMPDVAPKEQIMPEEQIAPEVEPVKPNQAEPEAQPEVQSEPEAIPEAIQPEREAPAPEVEPEPVQPEPAPTQSVPEPMQPEPAAPQPEPEPQPQAEPEPQVEPQPQMEPQEQAPIAQPEAPLSPGAESSN